MVKYVKNVIIFVKVVYKKDLVKNVRYKKIDSKSFHVLAMKIFLMMVKNVKNVVTNVKIAKIMKINVLIVLVKTEMLILIVIA